MKKIKNVSIVLLIILFVVTSFVISFKKAAAQAVPTKIDFKATNFGPLYKGPYVTSVGVCCNGLSFDIEPRVVGGAFATGSFIFPWQNMVPIPFIGQGFYSQWTIKPGSELVGSATPVGTCLTISSECETTETKDWTVKQVGTDLI